MLAPNTLSNLVATALISSAILSLILNFLLLRRSEKIKNLLKEELDKKETIFKSNYTWRERSLAELLGPMYILFRRTKEGVKRYNTSNHAFIEAKILKESNQKIRDLLIEKTFLIPIDLIPDAHRLIIHYDRWIEEFEKLSGETLNKGQRIDNNDSFVFVGDKGYPFPSDAESNFLSRYELMWKELYTVA